MQTWLTAAEISSGSAFRKSARGGRVSTAALSSYAASLVIKQRITVVGLDPATYSGHSLRSGFLTSPAEAGASLFELTEVSSAQVAGHAARLYPAGRSVQGARGGSVPVSARMTPEDALKRRCAAYHEAGHVVIVVHYNLPLMLASIVPGDAEHTLHHSPLRLLKEYRSSPMRARLAAEKGFHVCLAGAEAVRLIAPDRAGDGVENNHHEAAGFLIMLAEHEDERDAYNDLLCIQLNWT